jgi:hypothetical protein
MKTYNITCRQEKTKGLYSANKQRADRFYKVINKHKKYPLSIRNDLLKIEKNANTVEEYWCRIPLKAVRGGIWIRLKTYEPIPADAKICESKIYVDTISTGFWIW